MVLAIPVRGCCEGILWASGYAYVVIKRWEIMSFEGAEGGFTCGYLRVENMTRWTIGIIHPPQY